MRIDAVIEILNKIKEDRGNVNVSVSVPNCEHHFFKITKAYEYPTCTQDVAILEIEPIRKRDSFKEV